MAPPEVMAASRAPRRASTTQNWLKEILAQHGFTKDQRLLTMYGGMDLEEREDVKNAFQSGTDASNVRILLATDAAARRPAS